MSSTHSTFISPQTLPSHVRAGHSADDAITVDSAQILVVTKLDLNSLGVTLLIVLLSVLYLGDESLALHLGTVNVRPHVSRPGHDGLPDLPGLVLGAVVGRDSSPGQPVGHRVLSRQVAAGPGEES